MIWDFAHNIKNAEKLIQANKREVWDILEEVIRENTRLEDLLKFIEAWVHWKP